MTFAQLIEKTADERGLTRKGTRLVLESFFGHLSKAVWREGRVVVPGLASFNVRKVKARLVKMGPNDLDGATDVFRMPTHRVVRARIVREWRRRP